MGPEEFTKLGQTETYWAWNRKKGKLGRWKRDKKSTSNISGAVMSKRGEMYSKCLLRAEGKINRAASDGPSWAGGCRD